MSEMRPKRDFARFRRAEVGRILFGFSAFRVPAVAGTISLETR